MFALILAVSSCLYMKTYRVHRLFNNQSLVRMSISDRLAVVTNILGIKYLVSYFIFPFLNATLDTRTQACIIWVLVSKGYYTSLESSLQLDRQAQADLNLLRHVVHSPQGPGCMGAETGGGRRDPPGPLDGH